MSGVRSALLLLAALTPATVWAQPGPASVDLGDVLNVGDAVRVEDGAGRTWRGLVTRLGAAEFEIAAEGHRTLFRSADVREVAVSGDSLVNGTLIGFGIGGALGLLMGGFSGEYRAEDAMVGFLIVGGIGAGLGVGVDAMIRGDRVVYRRAPTTSVIPYPTRGGFGLAARLQW